jgi:hypothetical protein
VDVADDRLDVAHDLALERDQQAQDPVGGGVVGPHVEGQELGLAGRRGRDLALEGDALLALAVVGLTRAVAGDAAHSM